MNKVIMILSDALRNDLAAEQMGYLQLLVEERQASRYTVVAALPTLSRPLYETIHIGVAPSEHGIVTASNRADDVGAAGYSPCPNHETAGDCGLIITKNR